MASDDKKNINEKINPFDLGSVAKVTKHVKVEYHNHVRSSDVFSAGGKNSSSQDEIYKGKIEK